MRARQNHAAERSFESFMVKILVRGSFYRQFEERLKQAAPNAAFLLFEDREEMLARLSEADALYGGSPRGDMLDRCEKLRWIHMRSAGVDRYFPKTLAEHGVTLTNGSGAYDIPIAEHVFAMALGLTRQIHRYARNQTEALWERGPTPADLYGSNLGVYGMGAIGTRVAQIGAAFGMRAYGVARRKREKPPFAEALWTTERLDEMLRLSDLLVVCLPLTDATRGCIGEREFGLMKRSALFFNIGRGGTVDAEALETALSEGRIAGAGLDVTNPEPLPPESPLWRMENVIITPHVSGSSAVSAQKSEEIAIENIRRFAAGETLLNIVDPESGY